MKRYLIRNKASGQITHQFEANDVWPQPWPEAWGLPERKEYEFDPDNGYMKETGKVIPADFTVESVDLDADPDFIRADFQAKRRAAYASEFGGVEGQFDFIYHNSLAAWKSKVAAIKKSVQKPKILGEETPEGSES